MQLQPISTTEYNRLKNHGIFHLFPTYDFLQIKTLYPFKQSLLNTMKKYLKIYLQLPDFGTFSI